MQDLPLDEELEIDVRQMFVVQDALRKGRNLAKEKSLGFSMKLPGPSR